MAAHLKMRYTPDMEARMRGFYQTLSEKDRRRYAALEARRLGRGGIGYVAGYGAVRGGPLSERRAKWSICPTIRPQDACGIVARGEKKVCHRPGPRPESEVGPRSGHGGQSR